MPCRAAACHSRPAGMSEAPRRGGERRPAEHRLLARRAAPPRSSVVPRPDDKGAVLSYLPRMKSASPALCAPARPRGRPGRGESKDVGPGWPLGSEPDLPSGNNLRLSWDQCAEHTALCGPACPPLSTCVFGHDVRCDRRFSSASALRSGAAKRREIEAGTLCKSASTPVVCGLERRWKPVFGRRSVAALWVQPVWPARHPTLAGDSL